MQNYYDMLELDVNASLDDIKSKLATAKAENSIDEAQIRQISSILLNEKLKQSYDEKLFDFLLNQSHASKTNRSAQVFNSIPAKLDNQSSISDNFIYATLIMLGLNILTSFLPDMISHLANIGFTIATIIILIKDWDLLKTVGKNTFSKWWALFPIVYLYKRANRLETKQTYFFIYLGLSILSLILAGLALAAVASQQAYYY